MSFLLCLYSTAVYLLGKQWLLFGVCTLVQLEWERHYIYGLSSLDDGFLGSYIVPFFVCYVNFIVAVDFWL